MTEQPEEFKVDISDLDEWHELPFLDRVAVLRETVTVPEVAELLGLEADEGDKIPSPWNPDERTPSCHLYEDHFYDYSTGRGGDIFDLVMALNPDEYPELKHAVKAIHERAVRAGKEYGDVEGSKPRERCDFTHQLPPAIQTYQDPIDLFIRPEYGCIMDSGDLLVPHRDHDGVYGVKVRFANGGKGSWGGSQFMTRLYDPFGWAPGHFPAPVAVICEGESDCWALTHVLQGRADVYALPSGAGSWRDHWVDDLGSYNRVLVCMDNDDAGRRARDKVLLRVGYSRAERLDVPQLYGDAREAIKAGWRPSV